MAARDRKAVERYPGVQGVDTPAGAGKAVGGHPGEQLGLFGDLQRQPAPGRALDLFCCAGGATRGLQLVGFHVTGVDLVRSAKYCGDVFVRADPLAYLEAADLGAFDFIWASPPCQKFTSMRHAPGTKAHLDLIAPTRARLKASGKPYCIENVVGAPLIDPVTLCGSMFGLRTPDGAELRRHRLFETSFPLVAPSECRHEGPVLGIYGAQVRDRRHPASLNDCSGSNRPWEHAFIAMGVLPAQ